MLVRKTDCYVSSQVELEFAVCALIAHNDVSVIQVIVMIAGSTLVSKYIQKQRAQFSICPSEVTLP